MRQSVSSNYNRIAVEAVPGIDLDGLFSIHMNLKNTISLGLNLAFDEALDPRRCCCCLRGG